MKLTYFCFGQICLALLLTLLGPVQSILTKCSSLTIYQHWYERPGSGKCYFVSKNTDIATAGNFGATSIREKCRRKDADAYPVAVESWSEFTWLRAHLKDRGLTAKRWTGGKHIYDPDISSSDWGWKWIYQPGPNTAVSLYSGRWCGSTPSSDFGQCVAFTYCASLSATNKMRFTNRNCGNHYKYICEIEKSKLGFPIKWIFPGK